MVNGHGGGAHHQLYGHMLEDEAPRGNLLDFAIKHKVALSLLATVGGALLFWGWMASKYDSRLEAVESSVRAVQSNQAASATDFQSRIDTAEMKTGVAIERLNKRVGRVEHGVATTCTGIKILLGPQANAINCDPPPTTE